METVVLVIMILVGFNFVLKLTFHNLHGRLAVCAVAALFTALMWGVAVGQSKTQIADWLANPSLMLDTSVILTIDVFLQITFCVLMARKISHDAMPKWGDALLQFSLWFPGLLIFPVLFAILVEVIFSFPGMDFATLAWVTAGGVFIAALSLTLGVKWLLPEREPTLELMFLANVLTAILGIVATVNGRTAVAGTGTVEWDSLIGFLAILAVGSLAGLLLAKRNVKCKIKNVE